MNRKLLLPLLLVTLSSQLSYSTVYYVNASVQGGNMDGSSWENAFPLLNSAVIAAQYGDSIWVAQGTYRPTTGTNRNTSFTLKNGVKYFGGFTGMETSPDERNWETNLTILSGDIGVPSDSTDNSYNVVFCDFADSSSVLNGFVITGGNANSQASGQPSTGKTKSGGGMYLIGSSQAEDTRPVIINCKFIGNYAISNGGAIFMRSNSNGGASPDLINCSFEFNSANSGGAVHKSGNSNHNIMLVKDCTFMNNSANYGGGLNYLNSFGNHDVIIQDCIFKFNSSIGTGGGLSHENSNPASDLIITGCAFQENTSFQGNAISSTTFIAASGIHIDSCIFIANYSNGDGTIALALGNEITEISNSFFVGNKSRNGGCIFTASSLKVSNCIFTESVATLQGTVIYQSLSADVEFINCTLYQNSSVTTSSAIFEGSSNVSFTNCIFWENNLCPDNKLIEQSGSGVNLSLSNCLLDVPDCSSISNGSVNCDPGMLYQQDPLFTDTAAGDFTLLPCSPAIDAGDNAIVDSLGITTDLAGNPRILGGTVDMGAYEAPALAVAATTVLQPSCGGAEGAVELQMEHGCEPYSYTWSNTTGSGAGTTGLLPGTYTFTITDALGKTAEAEVEIPQAPAVMATVSALPFNCTNTTGGLASIVPTAGTAPFSYVWSTADTTTTAVGLLPGGYTVTVTDANGCTFTDTVEVETTGQLPLSISLTPIHCHDSADGTAAIMPVSGTAPFTWLWQDAQTDSLITNLSGGSYSVTVTDAVGCTGDLQFTLSAPLPLDATATGQNPACSGTAGGSATASATGGTPPYSYKWSNAQTTASISQLTPGTYTVTVTDANQCSDTASVVVASPPALTLSIEATETLCFGEENGTAAAVVSGGTPPYSFEWSNAQTDSLLTGLAPGAYTITITDTNGCTETESVNIAGSSAIQILLDTIINAGNVGASDGAVFVQQVFGGQPPYTYLWSNPDTIVGATQNLEDVPPGNYVLTVTDAIGCTQEFFFTVDVEVATGEAKNAPFRAVIVPNPSGSEKLARLSIDARQSQVLEVEVLDLYGRSLAVEAFNVNTGQTAHELTQVYAPGVYWVIIRNNSGGSMALKWVVM